jgi:DNA-binding SARP family transcriptional activator
VLLLSIRLLGTFEVEDHRGQPVVFAERARALVAYLALRITAKPTIGDAALALFGDAGAVDDVRVLVDSLNDTLAILPQSVLVDDGTTLRFKRELVSVDTDRFNDLIASPSINSVRKATDLYRSDLLSGLSFGMASFDRWLEERRGNLRNGALTIFGNLLSAQMRAGWWEEAVETAHRILIFEPTQEVVHRTLMRLHLEQGRPDAALRRYEECVETLRRTSGVLPGEETERLRVQIARKREEAAKSLLQSLPTALVLDEDLVTAGLIDRLLSELRYEVTIASDGTSAIEAVRSKHFNLLVVDVDSRSLDGLALFELMMQKSPHAPAFFVSGAPGTEAETLALEMGAAGFLRKPITKESFFSRLDSAVRRLRAPLSATNGHRTV